jgi:hypothetical protein
MYEIKDISKEVLEIVNGEIEVALEQAYQKGFEDGQENKDKEIK